MDKKLIIEVRANEFARRTGSNQNIPYTPDEIARDSAACREAGASIYHFHARTADGEAETDPAVYRAAMAGIRAGSDILVHPTLGYVAKAGGPRDRLAHVLALKEDPATAPHFAPIDLGSLNVDPYDAQNRRFLTTNQVYQNDTETLITIAREIRQAGMKPYLVSWSVGFTRQAEVMMEMELLDEPAFLGFLMTDGALRGGHPCTAKGLRAHLDFLPEGRRVEWTIICSGASALALAENVIREGGHISIGLGDHDYPELGAPTNADLVARVAELARAAGREVATPADVRRMLELPA